MMESIGIGGLGGTFGGNPLSCVAGLAAIEAIESENLIARAAELGRIVEARLGAMKNKYDLIGDVRNLGLSIGIELVKDRKTKEPAARQTVEVIEDCHSRGLMLMSCGAFKNVLRPMPPLIIEQEELECGLDIMEDAIATANKGM